jgi:hypothetical protein
VHSPKDILLLVEAVRASEWNVRKEAFWVLSNIATGGKDKHIHFLVELGSIDALCSVFDLADAKIAMVVLDTIEDYVGFVDECYGIHKIESPLEGH